MHHVCASCLCNDCKEKATKFLGIFIDENLSWTHHVANLNSKIARTVFMIKQVKYILPDDSLKTLYYALIQSHLTYGILAWGNASDSTLKKTKILQKRAIRCIHKANYNSHTDPLFKHSKLKKLTDIYETQVLLFMHNYVSNKLPESFNGTFVLNRDMMTSYITRQSNLLYEKKCLTHFASSLPLFNFPHIWNKWKNTLDMSMTRSQIKVNVSLGHFQKYSDRVTCQNIRCKDCHGD